MTWTAAPATLTTMYARPDALLCPTPWEQLTDAQGRPYFLWDVDMSLEALVEGLRSPDPTVRAYLLGKLMRQAKPDDVFHFVSLDTLGAEWDAVQPYLGNRRAFWTWLLDAWARVDREAAASGGGSDETTSRHEDPI